MSWKPPVKKQSEVVPAAQRPQQEVAPNIAASLPKNVEYAIRRVVEIVDQAWHGRSKNAKVMQHVQVIKEWLG